MKSKQWMGVVLLAMGVAGLALDGFSYTQSTAVLSQASVTLTARQMGTIAVPLWASLAVLLLGGLLLWTGRQR